MPRVKYPRKPVKTSKETVFNIFQRHPCGVLVSSPGDPNHLRSHPVPLALRMLLLRTVNAVGPGISGQMEGEVLQRQPPKRCGCW